MLIYKIRIISGGKEVTVFQKQDPMRRVLFSLIPIFIWSVYLYGWRVVALTGFVYLLGIAAEYVFEKGRGKKVSEAVLVSCGLYALSMPPGVPFWAAGVGILFAVIFGKEVYGGFGKNTYNPAIIGRTFVYIAFPLMLQTTWMIPGNFGLGGGVNLLIQASTWLDAAFMIVLALGAFFYIKKNTGNSKALIIGIGVAVALTIAFYVIMSYSLPYHKGMARAVLSEVDSITMATPIEVYRGLAQQHDWHHAINFFGIPMGDMADNSSLNLFLGLRAGSIGEGAIFLIILAGIYLLWTKTANWRHMLVTVASALAFTALFYYSGAMASRFPLLHVKPDLMGQLADIFGFMMAGSLLYAAVFMATDPVSGPKKPISQFLYGFIIGGLTIVIRVFAGFPEGVSFAILTANTFASLMDEVFPAKKKAAKAGAKAAAEGGSE